MDRKEVKSTNIAEVGYDPKKMLLEVLYHNQDIYQYHPVTQEAYNKFLKADSQGKWFWKNIRGNDSIKYNKMN